MRIALIGTGLIGGSIGLGARARLGAEVHGFDVDAGALSDALDGGAVTHAAASVAEAVEGAEIAFVAAPVSALPGLVGEALEHCGEGCVVSDVGSTKLGVMEAVAAMGGRERFVGGHPLAGNEQGGMRNARADLFEGAAWFLTADGSGGGDGDGGVGGDGGAGTDGDGGAGTGGAPARKVAELVSALGATPVAIDAAEHDRLLARVSHLPHVLANVLVAGVASERDELRELGAAGPSFRDATRVAGASTAVWKDIYLSNAGMLVEAIDEAMAELAAVRRMLATGDAEGLATWNERARQRRGP